jgi:hypothetical protein
MELRQRKVPAAPLDEGSPQSSPMMRRFAQADFFPKAKEEYRRQQSPTGAALSTATFVIIIMLVSWETLRYGLGWDAYATELSVDAGVSSGVPVTLDITFPAIPCHELNIDAMDASGAQENGVDHDLYKSPVDRQGNLVFHGHYAYVERRLGPDGLPLGPKEHDERRDPKSAKFCGSCYIEPSAHNHGYDRKGGVLDHHFSKVHADACCNTCDQVMAFYDMHRVPRPHVYEVEQCIDELSRANPGCNLKGTLHLRKVQGNIHFAPGHGAQLGPLGQHVHSFSMDQLMRFDVTHRVNHFAIGDARIARFSKQGVTFPLDDTGLRVPPGFSGYVKYYLQVVPTTYRSGAKVHDVDGYAAQQDVSFEFAATRHHRVMPLGMFGASPGVFFVFDFHPIQMNHVFERAPLSRFIVKLCSIVGGMFVILGFVDRAVPFLVKTFALPTS